jgi:transcriptional regulator with XRE-family HTH domain
MERYIHHGRNVKRIREILGIKQEALALMLGDDWNQQKVSLLEQKEAIDNKILDQVAHALKVPVDTFQKFSEEATINIIADTVNNHDQAASVFINPIEKIAQLYDEKIALLERIIRDKDAEIERLRSIK